jgi:hypothetical protein
VAIIFWHGGRATSVINDLVVSTMVWQSLP